MRGLVLEDMGGSEAVAHPVAGRVGVGVIAGRFVVPAPGASSRGDARPGQSETVTWGLKFGTRMVQDRGEALTRAQAETYTRPNKVRTGWIMGGRTRLGEI